MAIDLACGCGMSLHAADAHAGLHARCSECGAILKVPGELGSAPEPVAPPPVATPAKAEKKESARKRLTTKYALMGTSGSVQKSVTPSPAPSEARPATPAPKPAAGTGTLICAACGEGLSPAAGVSCVHCRADYHQDCWQEKGGCAVPTCVAGPKSRRRVVHYRGQEARLKPCPVCAELIPERAQRCRYCGEFTDAGLRRASKKKYRYPQKTSYLAGTSLILSLVSLVVIGLVWRGWLLYPAVILPLSALGIGIWAVADIHKAAGEKSGYWMAGSGLVLGSISLLSWFVNAF